MKRAIDEYTELLTQLSQSKLKFPETTENPELNELLGEKGLLMQSKNAKDREDIIREKILQRVEKELVDKFGEFTARLSRISFLIIGLIIFAVAFIISFPAIPNSPASFKVNYLPILKATQHQLISYF